MGDFERELRALEAKVYALPVLPLETRVAILEQGDWQIGAQVGGVCVRSFLFTVLGLHGVPLAGETVLYGPDPFDASTALTSAVTDGSGQVSFFTLDPPGGPNVFSLANPRFNTPALGYSPDGFASVCGGSASAALVFGADGTGGYTAALSPYPLKTTLSVDVATFGIVGLVCTYDGTSAWAGPTTVNFPGSATCPAVASLPIVVYLVSTVRAQFNSRQTSVAGPPAHFCPNATGAMNPDTFYGQGQPAGTTTVSGDPLNPSGLSVTVAPGATVGGPLFGGGTPPTVTFREV